MEHILFSTTNGEIYLQATPFWNGIIEYSYDDLFWRKWNGYDTLINSKIYLRGTNNTHISGKDNISISWIIKGRNIECQGNIENLLDYQLVKQGIHPKMDKNCFALMFTDCKTLTKAPALLSPTLETQCYNDMFRGCTNLHYSPCFSNMYIAKEAIINQHILDDCPIQNININNQLYSLSMLKLMV